AGRRAERPVAVGRGRTDAEGSCGVLHDVVRQDEELAAGRTQVDGLAELFQRHPYEPYVAEIQLLASLDAADAVDLPAADEAVHETARLVGPLLVLAERQLVNP